MSEPTLAALAALGAPLLKEAEAALAPEAEKVLVDLREFVSGEADKLRTELPAVVEQGVTHLHNLGAAILNRYHAVMERIDGHLTGVVAPSAPTAPVAPALATGGLVTAPSVSVDPTQPATSSSTSPATSDPTTPPSDGSSTTSDTTSAPAPADPTAV